MTQIGSQADPWWSEEPRMTLLGAMLFEPAMGVEAYLRFEVGGLCSWTVELVCTYGLTA